MILKHRGDDGIVLATITAALNTARNNRPGDRSAKDRAYSVAITDLEKVLAYFTMYAHESQGDPGVDISEAIENAYAAMSLDEEAQARAGKLLYLPPGDFEIVAESPDGWVFAHASSNKPYLLRSDTWRKIDRPAAAPGFVALEYWFERIPGNGAHDSMTE